MLPCCWRKVRDLLQNVCLGSKASRQHSLLWSAVCSPKTNSLMCMSIVEADKQVAPGQASLTNTLSSFSTCALFPCSRFFINQVVDVSNLLRGKLSSFSSSFYPLFTRPLFASSSTCSLPCFLLAAISAVFARGADCGFSDAGKIPIPSPRFMVSAAAFGLVHAIETPAPTYFLQIGQAGQARVSQIHQGEPLGCKHTDIDQRHSGNKNLEEAP